MELLYRFFISGTYQISSWEIFFSNSVHVSSHLLMTLDCAEILNFIEIYLQFFRLFSKLFVLFRNLLTAHLPQVFSSSGFSSDFKVSDLKWRSMVNLIWIMFYKLIYGDFLHYSTWKYLILTCWRLFLTYCLFLTPLSKIGCL